MKKIYRKLTKEQKTRGVIFSSQLIPDGIIHEVKYNDKNKWETIEHLKKDTFANSSFNTFTHNLIKEL